MMGLFARDDMGASPPNLPTRDVPVPELTPPGKDMLSLRVRALELEEYEALQWAGAKARDNDDLRGLTVGYVIAAVIDDAGAALFTEKDRPWLASRPAGVMERLYREILDLSGLSKKAQDAAAKNS